MNDPAFLHVNDIRKQQYLRDGYLLVESLLDPTWVKDLNSVIHQLTEDSLRSGKYEHVLEFEKGTVDGHQVPRRIFNPYEQHESFRQAAVDDRIMAYVQALIGPDIALQHSKLNMKPRKVGSVVEWHQDYTYFPHTNDSLTGVLIYLDDATAENGCLEVLPGLHTRTFDHALADGSFAGMITEDMNERIYGRPVSLAAPAGSVIFLHPFTPHRSAPNTSDAPRSTLIFEYRATDAFPLYTGSQLISMEACAHHLRGERKKTARFGGPAPDIYTPKDIPKSLYELQDASRDALSQS
ncbi:phytanoyl-CoA dioxygenase family protein [Rahnella sp. CG8]|uniref:phytanoyl-CoA dioxygenase family protein n=1 Tax=Rahnella sp. CG8 TaxID=2726078 RepID=UPI002033B7D9|nr:phytanoyl-CoA dioxygenase family protein [Rahnella sp. CG8]MCM2447763.1 phytanoyl-CoA dioxygenase family protein [Rahnella sp. CG8]